MEFKGYTHIEFNDNFLTFTEENGLKLSLSYSKVDVVRESPASNLLSINTKGHGSYDKSYDSYNELENDRFRIMSKGRSPKC